MKTSTATQRLAPGLKPELEALASTLNVPAGRVLETLLQSKSVEEIAAFINHKQPIKPVSQSAYKEVRADLGSLLSKEKEEAVAALFDRMTERSFRSLITRLDFELGDLIEQRVSSAIQNAFKEGE